MILVVQQRTRKQKNVCYSHQLLEGLVLSWRKFHFIRMNECSSSAVSVHWSSSFFRRRFNITFVFYIGVSQVENCFTVLMKTSDFYIYGLIPFLDQRSHMLLVSSVPCRVRQLSSRARAMVEWKTSATMIPSTIRSVMLFTYRPSSRRHVTPAPSTANRRVETTMRTGLSSVVLISRHFVSTTRRRVCPGWRERRTTRFYTLLHERVGKYFFSFCTVRPT